MSEKQRSSAQLYFDYLPVYAEIRKNPRLFAAMKDDPGVKAMHRINRYIYWILAVIFCTLRFI